MGKIRYYKKRVQETRGQKIQRISQRRNKTNIT